jgi:uracil-DNA glycosylase
LEPAKQIDFLTPDTSTKQSTWKDVLKGEKEEQYFLNLMSWLNQEKINGKIIYPSSNDIFNALQFTTFEAVKVVIIGQDPYHGPGQAHGLCFSVRAGIPAPPSLVNIFQEISNDIGIPKPNHGCLEKWAHQGVLLLNSILTVEANKPLSHANKGWEKFTDRIIRELNNRKSNLVFLLWGANAQKKGADLNRQKHLVLTAPHPSPLSAHRGFLGCKHFSQTNQYLNSHKVSSIDWSL